MGPVVATLAHSFSRWTWHYAALGLGIGMDQLTKYLCLALLPAYTPINLMPGLALQLVYNRGAAYGFFAGQTPWLVGIASLFSLYFMATFHVDRWEVPPHQSPRPAPPQYTLPSTHAILFPNTAHHNFLIVFFAPS